MMNDQLTIFGKVHIQLGAEAFVNRASEGTEGVFGKIFPVIAAMGLAPFFQFRNLCGGLGSWRERCDPTKGK